MKKRVERQREKVYGIRKEKNEKDGEEQNGAEKSSFSFERVTEDMKNDEERHDNVTKKKNSVDESEN